jgi:hypothetical protein
MFCSRAAEGCDQPSVGIGAYSRLTVGEKNPIGSLNRSGWQVCLIVWRAYFGA